MDPDELADFVIELIGPMTLEDRDRFIERLGDVYCLGMSGCSKPIDQCNCDWPKHY